MLRDIYVGVVDSPIEVSGGTEDGRKCYVIFTLGGLSWVVVDSPIEVSGGTEDGRKWAEMLRDIYVGGSVLGGGRFSYRSIGRDQGRA